MTKKTFSTKREALALAAPTDRDYIDVSHTHLAGFYVRVLKADARGRVRRSWVCRYSEERPDGTGGFKKTDRKEVLGLVEAFDKGDSVLPIEEAQSRVLAKRKALRESKAEAGSSRLTLGQAWAFYKTEKPHSRPSTVSKEQANYDRYLQHLKDRPLVELNYAFWSSFISQLRAGTLVVGQAQIDGQAVEETRGPLASATLVGVMNTAISLYQIAHRYRGLHGFAQGENPAKEAKSLCGRPQKRKGLIKLEHIGRSWLAADQLLSPWWRDLFKVALLTGLRKSLLWSMRFDEIDWSQNLLKVDPRKPGTKARGNDFGTEVEPTLIPMSSVVMDVLRQRRMFAPDPEGFVFYAPDTKKEGAVLTDQRKAWEQISKVTSGRLFTPHDLRRTFATLGSVAAEGELFGVALLLMHSSTTLAGAAGLPEITVRYINTPSSQEKMRKTTEAISSYVLKLVEQEKEGKTAKVEEAELSKELEEALAED